MSNPSPIFNSTVEALDRALADLETRVAALPPQPVRVVAFDENVKVTLNADGQLVSAQIKPEALKRGLSSLADTVLELQDRAIAALTSASGGEGVDIEFAEPAAAPAPALGRTAPQLPEMPSFADIDRVAAAFDARFGQVASLDLRGEHRAASEWVELKVDAAGKLSELLFLNAARAADPVALADDLVETAARARAGIESRG